MGRAAVYTLVGFALMIAGVAGWLALRPPPPRPTPSREATEAQLTEYLGPTAGEVVERLGLGDAERYWADEPPGVLRGLSYYPADGRQLTLYIAEGEPLFRKFSDRREWDYTAFLGCRVGGIRYEAGEVRLALGPAR